MAQSKLNDLASKLGKGGAPKGLGTGLKLLGVAAACAYGASQSVFTGKQRTAANKRATVYLSNYIMFNLQSRVATERSFSVALVEYKMTSSPKACTCECLGSSIPLFTTLGNSNLKNLINALMILKSKCAVNG